MRKLISSTVALSLMAGSAAAHQGHEGDAAVSGITSPANVEQVEALDILFTHAHSKGNVVTFHMTTNGIAGAETPKPVGQLSGAPAYAYVWPTSLDPSSVGFDEGAGILALAAAVHPDFDDTPLFDENLDGDTENDGQTWHSHWVVLSPTETCGPGALAVKDIPEGTTPKLPATWPGLPILLDSPGFTPLFEDAEVKINVAFPQGVDISEMSYDGVTAALRVNANIHSPLFCVTDVFDVASGDLSLPGKLN